MNSAHFRIYLEANDFYWDARKLFLLLDASSKTGVELNANMNPTSACGQDHSSKLVEKYHKFIRPEIMYRKFLLVCPEKTATLVW
jgi:hypothetical protein